MTSGRYPKVLDPARVGAERARRELQAPRTDVAHYGRQIGSGVALGLSVLTLGCIAEPCEEDYGSCRFRDPLQPSDSCRVTSQQLCTEICVQGPAVDCEWDGCESC